MVALQGRKSLEESLAKFTEDEHMAGENQLVCESCEKVIGLQRTSLQLRLSTLSTRIDIMVDSGGVS